MTLPSKSIIPGALQDEVDPNGELTPLQRAFVDAYLLDPTNKKAAAVAAGVSEASAAVRASQWLRQPIVAACIARAMGAREDRTKLTQDRVLQEVFVMLTARIDDFEMDESGNVTTRDGIPDYMMAAVQRVKRRTRRIFHRDGTEEVIQDVELALWDKPSAARLAMQHLGLIGSTRKKEPDEPSTGEPKGEWLFGDRKLRLR
jgi:phage terminase small subunit